MKLALSPWIAQTGKPHSWVSLMFTCVIGLPRPGNPNALKDVFDSPGRSAKGLGTTLTLRDAGTEENSLLQAHAPDLEEVVPQRPMQVEQPRTLPVGKGKEQGVSQFRR